MVDERSKARLAHAELLLRVPELRDVLQGTEFAQRPELVPCHVSLTVNDADRAVGPNHPVLDVVARAATHRGGCRVCRFVAVLGVNDAEPALVPLREVEWFHAENPPDFIGQRDLIREEIPLPPADMRD